MISPSALAGEARKLERRFKSVKCSVMGEKQLAAKKMAAILAVGSGSSSGPKLIVLEYAPASSSGKTVVGLVGKAVTFDSGGISIKPARNMGRMKLDKSGGAAVLATVMAAAELGLKTRLYGIIPAAENMPGPKSYRPGDIITTFSSKTVEVESTDAEGRLLLCDAISYADKLGC
jgi:leucyl aminopeptidase